MNIEKNLNVRYFFLTNPIQYYYKIEKNYKNIQY